MAEVTYEDLMNERAVGARRLWLALILGMVVLFLLFMVHTHSHTHPDPHPIDQRDG